MSTQRHSSTVSAGGKRHSVAEEQVTSVLQPNQTPIFDRELDADDAALAALGYKPEFKREFTLWTCFCVSFAVLGLLPSFASTLYYGMGYAGTPGMVWGWIIAMIFIQCVAMGMAELCSAMPTSGGLYYAAAVLAPPGYGPLCAWIVGWSNWLVQVTGAPSVDYALSAMILAAASITHPSYVPETWHVFLLTALIMIIHAGISSMPTKWIAIFNSYGTSFNIIALVITVILIPAMTNRQEQGLPRFTSSSVVWGTFYEGTDFPNGIATLMSFIAVIWTMSGYDAAFHLAEECSNASVSAPRAIVLTSGLGGIFGWALQMVVAYTVVDIDGVLDSEVGQPWAAVLMQVLPQNAALGILAITIISSFFMGQGCMVAASRVTFCYARDGTIPGSKYWSRVNPYTQTPVNAVWFNATIGLLLVLLAFGGDIAIGAIFSIGAISAFVAFTLPITIKTFFVGNRFKAGPWNLGRFSPVVGTLATCFTLLMIPILCLPPLVGDDLDASTMNWTCVVWGVPMLGVMIWWVVDAHKWFKGPKVNIEHAAVAHDITTVLDAKDGMNLDSTNSEDSGSQDGLKIGKHNKELSEADRDKKIAHVS